MIDFDQLGPSVIEYNKSPVFVGVVQHDDGKYLGGARLVNETSCPLFKERRLEDHLQSFLAVTEKSCLPVCKGYVWIFEIPLLENEKVPDNLESARILKRHTGDIIYEFYDQGRSLFMKTMMGICGNSVNYDDAIAYIKEHQVAIQVPGDRTEEPGPRITEYFLDDVLQARVTNTCGMWPMEKTDEEMSEVQVVFEWVKKRGFKGLQLVDGQEGIIPIVFQYCTASSETDD